ncbi:substrate-binding domain-containing protein [Pararhizobium sp. DWP3-4]|uniref:substrate-binding domain-containing protein n=1 Tax=Pararhizobium sp. DWP3-4 TaxID=2804565 RepID=UPI003CE83906
MRSNCYGGLAAAAEARLSITNDISVIGFDNESYTADMLPPLTTMELPHADMAHYAVEKLAELVATLRLKRENQNEVRMRNCRAQISSRVSGVTAVNYGSRCGSEKPCSTHRCAFKNFRSLCRSLHSPLTPLRVESTRAKSILVRATAKF